MRDGVLVERDRATGVRGGEGGEGRHDRGGANGIGEFAEPPRRGTSGMGAK